MPHRLDALLLLGPTGSGKTPLGNVLEARGLAGRRCVHFDFGAQLRDAVARDCPDDIVSREDLVLLRGVLETGALLEDDEFPLAERILRSFLVRCGAGPETLLILNGLPRHIGQAAALAGWLDVRTVICLDCAPETVLARLAANAGGDRADRTDDDPPAVVRKLAIYAERTAPLIAYYLGHGVRITSLEVGADTTAEQLWQRIEHPPAPRRA